MMRGMTSIAQRLGNKSEYLRGRGRARWISLWNPGVDIDAATIIGKGSVVRCARGGQIILRGTEVGSNVHIGAAPGAVVQIGAAQIARGALIAARESVVIEDGALIGDIVSIRDHDHTYSAETGVSRHEWTSAPIIIREFAWIGAHAVVTKGVEIGARALVAAGGVATSNVPAGTIVGGGSRKKDSLIHGSL